jgi:malate synthase
MLDEVKRLEQEGNVLFQAGRGSFSSKNTAKAMFEFIYAYEKVIHQLNAEKAKLDSVAIKDTVSEEDKIVFETAFKNFQNIVHELTPLKRAVKARRRQQHLKIHSDLFHSTLKKIAFLENIIISGKRCLKEASMSPKQIAASRAASIRMSLRWGM